MISKHSNFKVFNIIAVLFLATMLLTACGSFNFQAQTAPSEDGGITITGGVDPLQPESTNSGQTINPTIVILLLVGFGVLVLILLLLVSRPSGNEKSS